MNEAERGVLEAIDERRLVDDVRRLVAVESWNGAESAAQDVMAELMTEAGLKVDRWDIDLKSVRAHPDASWEIERDAAVGLVGLLEGTAPGGRRLVLNGHVDVVPPGDPDLWTHPPFSGTVAEGRIYGRGALDMKGPLVAGLHAVRAIARSGPGLEGSVAIQSVVGEEDGGIGTLATILRGPTADAAIVLEPTELAVAPVQAGCVNFRIGVRGSAAHGAVRDEGVSALEKLFGIYRALEALEEARNDPLDLEPFLERYRIPFPISVGTVRGGDWASSVPDLVVIEGRMGVRPGEDLTSARAALEDAVAEAAYDDAWLRHHPPTVQWWGGRFLPMRTPVDHALTTTLTGAVTDVTGTPARLEGVTFGADAGLLSSVGGIPTLLFGGGDIRRAHRPDEYVEIDELTTMARCLALATLRFCS
jgi:acetylornithine deacetylase